mgnify:CR=1 FL=1
MLFRSVKTFEYGGLMWPLPQTGQMWLEIELLNNPQWDGVFCITTSYREEKNPIPGRHELIFPMFEFESKGTMKDLEKLETELLEFLGFNVPVSVDYNTLCLEYETDILESNHEEIMWRDLGSAISLQKDRKSTRLNSSHVSESRMPSSA